ncbi:polysaccharide biosynthesis/export family protein [Mangrovimonas aestuarii]|uniref:polysaccharide biosynthesis/export family protein n=1 Tax=Mangrovimonas aestuarii TaxID=3018443 RepID=UPI002378DD51|nr:polysaccharide biosynthesis/export family protein [Mangrovimonas aestuarii]
MKIQSLLPLVVGLMLTVSCASKKEVLYFQDANSAPSTVTATNTKIQVNDILNITVSALVLETALPYNIQNFGSDIGGNSQELLKLKGYLVTEELTITFPVLGTLDVSNKTTEELEVYIEDILETGGHLKDPVVSVRILNTKVTILGEVRQPGTYGFTEKRITLPQALGYAGDMTINGFREDVLVIREIDGIRTIGHVDMTTTTWFDSPYYYVKPNDVIVVNPNGPKIKKAGFIGDVATVLTLTSVMLSAIVLITRI